MGIVDEDIRRVREQTDIVQIINQHTQLRKVGTRWQGSCPFHDENTPSFSVNYELGVYYCFGCRASGDAITFVREKENLDFAGAVEYLAAKANISLRYTDKNENENRGRRKELLDLVGKAVDFYQDCLLNRAEARPARDYLKSRGYNSEIAKRFSLGWAPAEWDELSKHLNVSADDLKDAGLGGLNRYGKPYDFFRDRVMFPIFNEKGEPIGFGGRQLPDGEGPKYKNTSDAAKIYSKSQVLYGLNWAKTEAGRLSEIVVCEGYTDVIGAHLAGVERAVATCGTAITSDHVKKLRRFAPRIVFAFDADNAGKNAAERVYGWEEEFDLEFAIADLPEGVDPGELSREDPAALRQSIEEAKPFLQFLIDRELERGDLSTPDRQARTALEAARLVIEHPNPLVGDSYLIQIADTCHVNPDELRRRMKNLAPRTSTRQRSNEEEAEREEIYKIEIAEVERQALEILLRRREEIAEYLLPALFLTGVAREAYEAVEEAKGDFHAAREGSEETVSSVLVEIVASESTEADSLGVISRLLTVAAEQKAAELSAVAKREDSYEELLEDIQYLRGQVAFLREIPKDIKVLKPLFEWFRSATT
jgi:DNA primase